MRPLLLFCGVAALWGCNPTKDSCSTYVKEVNSLSCLSGQAESQLSPVFCEEFDDYKPTCNRDEYFACLTKGYTCNGDQLNVDVRECVLKECPRGQGESLHDEQYN